MQRSLMPLPRWHAWIIISSFYVFLAVLSCTAMIVRVLGQQRIQLYDYRSWARRWNQMMRFLGGPYVHEGDIEAYADRLSHLSSPHIVVSNHQTNQDIILASFVPKVRILMKKSLLQIPIFGAMIKAWALPVSRDTHNDHLMVMARLSQALGENIFLFPEGTRCTPEKLHRFKTGVAVISHDLKMPVQAVVHTLGHFYHKSGWHPVVYGGCVRLTMLPLILPPDNLQKLRLWLFTLQTMCEQAYDTLCKDITCALPVRPDNDEADACHGLLQPDRKS